MTLDGFVQKWRRRKDDVIIQDVSLRVANCDESNRSRFRLEAKACAWIYHRGVEVCASAQSLLGTRKMAACRREVIRKLDQQLTNRVDWVLALDAGNPRLSKPVLVVLAGAGFSCGLGLPSTADLGRLSLRRCKHPDPRGDILRVEKDKYPLSEFRGPKGRIADIEYLLTIWSGYLDQLHQSGYPFQNEPVRYRLFLENICCHLHTKSKKAALSRQFSPLVKWLGEAVAKYDVRFVTFNYDTIIELMCRQAGLRFTYLDRKAEGCVIPIRKLHGSLNWRAFDKAMDFSADKDAQRLFRDGERSVFCFNDVSEFSTRESGHAPFIIPPSAGKEYDPLLRQVWCFAKGDIDIAERILIVGYSFPAVDAFAEIHLVPRLSGKSKKITYISPCASDCRRIKELLNLAKLKVFKEPWRIDHFSTVLR